MLSWIEFEKECLKNNFYTINNNSTKNIVFFGNCTIATIGFFLNQLLDKQYNIHFIISWLFEKKGLEKFNMESVNNIILNLLKSTDILLYHRHEKDYGINATKIRNQCKKDSIILEIPNFHLHLDQPNPELFHQSLLKLKSNIVNKSDFKEFDFVYYHYKTIRFFNTSVHPTHYLLFLLAKSIKFRLINDKKIINIQSYYNEQNKNQFKSIKEFVCLPGFIPFTKEILQITGIQDNAEYFDL
jgi:hypothetical protein